MKSVHSVSQNRNAHNRKDKSLPLHFTGTGEEKMKTVEEILNDIDKSKLQPGNHLYIDEIVQLGAIDDSTYNLVVNAFKLGFYKGVQTEKNRVKRSRS